MPTRRSERHLKYASSSLKDSPSSPPRHDAVLFLLSAATVRSDRFFCGIEYVKSCQLIGAGVALGMIYAVIAFGYQLTFQTSDTPNFGQGDAPMLGAMVG
jgi:hypothetical protein